MSSKKFFTIFMIIFMLFSVSGCGGSGGHTQNLTNNPVSPDKPVPIPEPKSDDITIIPEPSPLSQDKPVSQEPIPTPIISHDPVPTPMSYTVTFNSNGGSAVSSITISSGNAVTKPNDPSKYGYTFDGWYKDSELTQVFRFGENGDKVTGNITLYAKWIENDRLRAEIAIGKISIVYQDGDNANSVTKNIILPTSLNVSGDVNISWSSNSPSVISNSGIVTRPSGRDIVVVLTAKATAGSASRTKTFTVTVLHKATPEHSGYTVTFNSNGGSAVASINTSPDGTVNMPENPTKAGYVFAGWFKDKTFTEFFTFGTDGNKITGNITLYAQWLDADLLIAEYATSEIVIGYADGDNPKYVTQNLTLPTKIRSADILWSSTSATISTSGNVTRQADDTDVTLTAIAIYNGKSAQAKTFTVKVIRKRTRNNNKIQSLTVSEASSGDISVRRNEAGNITDIEGQYISFDIRNADDALDAVTTLRSELGVRSPDKELVVNGATINKYGAKYSLGQSYNGLKIYGRRIIVSANSSGKANFLDSNFLSSDVLTKANLNDGISQSRAEEIAKTNYSNDITCKAQEVIYSFGQYEKSPVRVWIVTISGINKDGYFADETLFIKSSDGTILSKSSNITNMVSHYGVNELNQVVQFPVTYEYSLLEFQ